MLEHFFVAPWTLERLRSSGAGAYIDSFAGKLKEDGYCAKTARNYLRSTAHLGCFLQSQGQTVEILEEKALNEFLQHLPHCQCPQSAGGVGRDVSRGTRQFFKYLGKLGVVNDNEIKAPQPPLVESFRHWLKQHCGYADSTVALYSYGVARLVNTLGDDPGQYDAQTLRDFVLQQARRSGRGATKALIKALRTFLRYLAIEGKCSAGLDQAIPTVAGWRLTSLPRYLSSSELERTIDTCDVDTLVGARDRAILLLLAQLGLRGSDVAGLDLPDFDWKEATVLVSGKSRWEARLPLPQEVGDAVLKYLEHRPMLDSDRVFISVRPPWRPLTPGAVSAIARRAIHRAGVSAPSYGSHIFRHTAATQMLRQGAPLEEIRTVLRHRSVDMTATYAKVDIELLRAVAQPWPEVLR
jgi:site-specific recombinase XerD